MKPVSPNSEQRYLPSLTIRLIGSVWGAILPSATIKIWLHSLDDPFGQCLYKLAHDAGCAFDKHMQVAIIRFTAAAADQDNWVMEALANYSALLYLEMRNGPKALDAVLAEYRKRLLERVEEDRTVESMGPIVWGARLSRTGTTRS
jgi:hypothetical protein